MRATKRIAGVALLIFGLTLTAHGQGGNGCTESVNQTIYTTKADEPIQTSTLPVISGKRLEYTVGLLMQDREEQTLRLKDVVLLFDYNADIPVFIVFSKRGTPYCSKNTPLLDFPDHFSYRALTKDKKIITAGILPSEPIRPGQSIRKLVNDNINKEAIADVEADDLVMECYRTKNWVGETYSIRVHASPAELDKYRYDIMRMMNQDYAALENIVEMPEEEEVEEEEDFSYDGDGELFAIDSRAATPVGSGAKDESDTRTVVSPASTPTEETDKPIAATEEEVPSDPGLALEEQDGEEETMEEETMEEVAAVEPENANLGKRSVPKLEDSITDKEMEEIQAQAEFKLKELESCFVKLTNRKLNPAQKKRVRESAVEELFINERAHVAVSSLNNQELSFFPIPDYLLRLENLISGAYMEVEIAFSEIHKVTNFKPNPDGTWSATVTFSQEFRGYKDVDGRQPTYSDITQKNVTVRIRRVELFTGDATPDVYWEVLLADIGVNQTEPF